MTPLQQYLARGGLMHILKSYADYENQLKVWIEKENDGSYRIIEKEIISIGKPPSNAVEDGKIFLPSRADVLTYLIETFHLSKSQAEEVIEQIGVFQPTIT